MYVVCKKTDYENVVLNVDKMFFKLACYFKDNL